MVRELRGVRGGEMGERGRGEGDGLLLFLFSSSSFFVYHFFPLTLMSRLRLI